MHLSYLAHYKNKYPGGQVFVREDSIDVIDANGVHVVALRKNGAGQLVCVSEQLGLSDRHCLAPIPKEARAWKHFGAKDGKKEHVGPSEEHEERSKIAAVMAKSGKVLSAADYEKEGWEFDKDLVVKKAPKG